MGRATKGEKIMIGDVKKECLLKKVEWQEEEAREFGFYWENMHQLIEQIQNECVEVQEAYQKNDRQHLQEEIGDLIQATISLAVFFQFDPHETLLKSIDKFQKRYDIVVKLAREDGLDNLRHQSFDVLMSYWNRAKKAKTKPR